MKKVLIVVGLGMGLVFGAKAQPSPYGHAVQSFMNSYCRSITISNNPVGVTNLNSLGAIGSFVAGAGTNTWGTTFTNSYGLSCLVTNNAALTNSQATFENLNLFTDVELFPGSSRETLFLNNTVAAVATNTLGTIQIRLVGQSGANSAVNFTFTPLYDGTNEPTTPSGEAFTVGVTAVTTTPVCVVTNLPNRFAGARKLRLRCAANTDVDATSKVDLLQCVFVGFPPSQVQR